MIAIPCHTAGQHKKKTILLISIELHKNHFFFASLPSLINCQRSNNKKKIPNSSASTERNHTNSPDCIYCIHILNQSISFCPFVTVLIGRACACVCVYFWIAVHCLKLSSAIDDAFGKWIVCMLWGRCLPFHLPSITYTAIYIETAISLSNFFFFGLKCIIA